jgi:hypothetical protein
VNNDVSKRRRRSIRLRGYDYAQAGAYFVTIVTKDRACLFGEILDGKCGQTIEVVSFVRRGMSCRIIIPVSNAMDLS